VVKDDENLTNQDYCTFYDRAKLVLENLQKMEEETGRKAVYVANVTAPTCEEMLRRATFVQENGGLCLMIDLMAAGWTALQTLREHFPDMIIHGHRAGHGAQTTVHDICIDGRDCTLRHGISMKVLALFARLGGVDQLHIGAPLGKMDANEKTALENLEMITRPMGHIKPCLAINSGGLSPDKFPDVVRLMAPPGQEKNLAIVFQAGGGTHAHPLGTFGGAKAMIQARQMVLDGTSLFEELNQYYELRLGFRRWAKPRYDEWVRSLTPDAALVIEPDTRAHALPEKMRGDAPAAVSLGEALERDETLRADVQELNPDLLS
jgi:ribulose-bisphosphate carboxylase large chain